MRGSAARRIGWNGTLLAAVGVTLLLAAGVAVSRVLRTMRAETAAFHPRRGAVERPPVLAGIATLRDVSFEAQGGVVVRGWYIPSANRAAILLAHGSMADRTQMSNEARALADAGFGVLTFDWPGHGESGGKVMYGRGEREALEAAISFVVAQPDVDPVRVGALGFSMGAGLVAAVAGDDKRLRSIVLISPFADSFDQTRVEFAGQGAIAQWAALRVDRANMPDGALRPIDGVGALRDQSLLVIAAADDPVVPLWMSEEVYTAANGDKELVVLPTGGHPDMNALPTGPGGPPIHQFFQRMLLATTTP